MRRFIQSMTACLLIVACLTLPPIARPQPALALDDTVTCGWETLNHVLNNVQFSGGGTIDFDCGDDPVTISHSGSATPITTNVVIDGGELITLSGDSTNQLFKVSEGATLELRNIMLSDAAAEDGGAIYNDGGTVTIVNSKLSHNSAEDDGGAIYNDGGTVTIINSTFSHNSASSDGGMIFTNGGEIGITGSTVKENTAGDDSGAINNSGAGEVTIVGSTFVDNGADDDAGGIYNDDGGMLIILHSKMQLNTAGHDSGAIYNREGGVFISYSELIENSADVDAGAIYNEGDAGTLTIEDSTLRGNTATEDGGAVFNDEGFATITRSTLQGNKAGRDGGALFAIHDGDVGIFDSTLDGNIAGDDGGAIDNGEGGMKIVNSTLSGNRSDDHGGAINHWDATLLVLNSTLVGNTSTANAGGLWLVSGTVEFQNSIIASGGPPNCINDGGTLTSLGYNLSDDDSCALSAATNDLIVEDVQLQPLGDNGSPTQTHFPVLDPDNPIFNAIPTDACPVNDLDERLGDQRGQTRPQPDGGNCDIGSVEVFNLTPSISAVTANPNPVGEGSGTTISVTASDPVDEDDDSLGYAFDCDGDGVFEIARQASAEVSCSYLDDELVGGSVTVGVEVTDSAGLTTAGSVDVSVENVAPTIVEATVTRGGNTAVVTVIATDPAGEHDPLTYAFDCDNDGTYELDAGASSSATCDLGTAEGTFTIGVLVTDDEGGFVEDVATISIVTELCANGYTGVLRYSADCQSHETTITLPDDGPVEFCANGYTGILRAALNGTCTGHERSYELPEEGPLNVCISSYTSLMRAVDALSECARHERGQVIAATEITAPPPVTR